MSFVDGSFRDVADQDYIAARICYQFDLKLQFLWAAEQCIEKYLKGIFLYNGVSVKQYGHDVDRQLGDLPNRIRDIAFKIPKQTKEFVDYIDCHGSNRYFTKPFSMEGTELLELDRAVWSLRRYCQDLRLELAQNGKVYRNLHTQLSRIHDKAWEQSPSRFRITSGWLERLVDDNRSGKLRPALTWKNFFFGRTTKARIKNFTFRGGFANPVNSLHPSVFPVIKKMVRL